MRFYLDTQDDDLFFMFKKSQLEIEKRVTGILHNTLGPEFELNKFTITHGSIEIIAIIGASYYAVSKYKNFVESINLAKVQIKNLLLDFSGDKSIKVSSSWLPGSALATLDQQNEVFNCNMMGELAMKYIIATHFILLCFAIYVAMTRLV